MAHRVTIQPSGHEFNVEEGETVLEAALREGFALPYGCRNGACGSCKGRILAGGVDYGDIQEAALPAEDRAEGKALFCQARPLGDLSIEVREIGAAKDIQIKTLPCRVHKIERRGEGVIVLYLKLPMNERLQFLAGQYIDILLKDGKRRSFSLANAPHDDAYLELHVANVSGGVFTEHVFGKMKEKDILRFEGPLGTFFLREDDDKPIIMLATGTGFAPIKGMIEHALHAGLTRPMVLYWGARSLKDLYMPELPSRWQQEHDHFSFVPVLSKPLPEDGWAGRTGHVQTAVLQDFEDLSGWQVYACGSPKMVQSAHQTLVAQRRLPEDEFYSDAFLYANEMKRP